MPPEIVTLFQNFHFMDLLATFAALWFFYNRLDKKIEKLDVKIEKVEQTLSNKMDKFDEKLTDIDRRLCRLEGAFSSKDCCMLKNEHHQKAE